MLEEFYTVHCQVAGIRDLYDSLNEINVKDTLEGDNMYTCSKCGKKYELKNELVLENYQIFYVLTQCVTHLTW
jgi:hypothetical protein